MSWLRRRTVPRGLRTLVGRAGSGPVTLLAAVLAILALMLLARPTEADDPLAPTTRLGRPAHVVHHHVTGVGYRANGPAGTIGVLDPRTGGVVREIEVGQRVDLVALSEDGLWLYAFSPSADRLVVIALATERVVRRVPLAGGTKGVKRP